MPRSRDAFAQFDELRRTSPAPPADVFYVGDPPRAIVQVELPGINPDAVTIEVRGRELLLAGRREPPRAQGRLYQQVETTRGPFRRVIELGADVEADAAGATYRDGILEITLPLVREEQRRRTVPITERDRGA